MKKVVLVIVFFVAAINMQAQELKWHTNVNDAIAVSTKEKKPLLLFFTGSDWCGWCIRLQKEVFLTPEFTQWAKANVVLVELDFPRKTPQTEVVKKQNNELQQAFSVQGFPTIHFANSTNKGGKINFQGLGNTGYVPGGPKAWLAVANEIIKTNPLVKVADPVAKKATTKKS